MSNSIVSGILGLGLITSNFYTLSLLSNKEFSIPNIADLPSNKYSSLSVRSTHEGDKKEWMISSRQHDPKTLLYSKDVQRDEQIGRKSNKTNSYVHRETIASANNYSTGETQEAINIECIETTSKASARGEVLGVQTASNLAPTLSSVPIIGPLLVGISMVGSRKAGQETGKMIAEEWSGNC
tara:strand:+ start:304 stop:849 length:546 start_codon:yes stop_codon:yes gene_type:complete